MKLINQTNIRLDLEDLLNREWWTVERNGLELRVKSAVPLNDWAVIVSPLKGKKPYSGFCEPGKKLITIRINPANSYPFTQEIPTGTWTVWKTETQRCFKYVGQPVTFSDPNELVRWIFCHEFSHVLDYLQGFSLRMKQTKANRFALKHYKKEAER